MTNKENLYMAAKAARNYLMHNREDYVIEILMEQYNLSLPQAKEAVKIAKGLCPVS